MSPYTAERDVALRAVQRAALLTQAVFHRKAKGTLSKSDTTPVTLGDFGAQALINDALHRFFPQDAIVGEEDAYALREDPALCKQVWELVQDASSRKLSVAPDGPDLGPGPADEDAMLTALDRGKGKGGAKCRFWTVDPIDGTKGFVRGGQYAVCLALIEDGVVQLGVLGCPNLPVDDGAPVSADVGTTDGDALFHPGRGVLFAAVRGQGATSRPLDPAARLAPAQTILMREVRSAGEMVLCESVEAAHTNHGEAAEIRKLLGIGRDSVRMDSQAKYGSVARGAGDLVLRLLAQKGYRECIWDVAAAEVIVHEAGGTMTDAEGKPQDFSRGRRLFGNTGVVTAPKGVHAEVIAAVRKVVEQSGSGG